MSVSTATQSGAVGLQLQKGLLRGGFI